MQYLSDSSYPVLNEIRTEITRVTVKLQGFLIMKGSYFKDKHSCGSKIFLIRNLVLGFL